MVCSFSKEFSSASFTQVENQFISIYLPESTGDAVKVYLYGLYLCSNCDNDTPISSVSTTLKLSEEEIVDCFKYWEEFGLVSIISENPLNIKYLPIGSEYSHKPHKIKAEKYTEFVKALQSMTQSRMISTNEYTEYFNIMEVFHIKPEAMISIVNYCFDKKGSDVSYKYVAKVAKDFGEREINTLEKVEKELSSYITNTGDIEKILSALSLRRKPDIDDQQFLKKWKNDLSFELPNIVFAASKMKKGSMEKLDKFLMELYSMKSFSKEEISDFISRRQEIYDTTIAINRALSHYEEIIDTEIEVYINKWLSLGFSKDTLLYIASYCFKEGKNTLNDMDSTIEMLYNHGFISLSGVNDYFEEIKQNDIFISKILTSVGISRRPVPFDRDNLSTWRSWNMSDEMILSAASLSAGKSSPIAYMHGILSNWKNNGVLTVDEIEIEKPKITIEEYNLEYARRRTLSVRNAQNNLNLAMSENGFPETYSRLNTIEKDLAYAEIENNAELLKDLEKEKADLVLKAEKILSKHKLTLSDLTPKHFCNKCKDTGFIGSNKCDCFENKPE